MALEIAEHGPEPSASLPGPFVEPDHPGDLQEREGRSMDQTHHRPKTPWHAQGVCEPHPRAAAHRNTHVPEGRTHAQTMAAIDGDEGRKALSKHPPQTGGVSAEKAPDLQIQEKLCPGQRHVGNRAPVDTRVYLDL
jgi:hypothetical protein